MLISDLQETLKELCLLRPSLHRQKIYDLNKQQRLAATRLLHCLDQLAQTGNESIVADAQQWTTRDVAHARSFDDQYAGTPFREAPIPIEVLLRDESVLRRSPRHHRRYPRAAACLELPKPDRTKEPRARCLVR